MSCPQCFSGHVHSGQPKGTFETVFGRRTYVASPPEGKEAKGIIVIVPDAFGVDFVNNQILADHYSSAGQWKVYLPDFMDGTAAPVSCMLNMAYASDAKTSWFSFPYYILAAASTFIPFMIRNRFGVSWPKVTSFLTPLRSSTSLPIGVAGFCWGGQHAISLTHALPECSLPSGKPLIDAAFGAHVSNVTVPADAEKIVRPFSLAQGDKDFVMGIKQTEEFRAVLDKKKGQVESEVVVYPGAGHGFAVRASKAEPDSMETRQAEEAEKQAVAWFQRQFAKAK